MGLFSFILVIFSSNCVCTKYTAVAKLLLPACTTLALCLDYNFNHWLIKEPVSENPLKLIYRVMCYAWKNKYPRQRSAFTYWDDKPYSRIDLAKSKFGGPFTTERVEDVKTFWRILLYLLVVSFNTAFITNVQSVAKNMRYHLQNSNFGKESITSCSAEYIGNCFQREAVYTAGYPIAIILIPLYDFMQRKRIIKRYSSIVNFNIGLFLALMSMAGYFSLELAGHIKLDVGADSTNITCLLEVKHSVYSTWNSIPLDYEWIAFPECLRTLSYFFLITGMIQFICAQSPYSMKGLIFGLAYAIFGFSVVITYLMMLPISYTVHKWPATPYGCGTWYLLSVTIVHLLVLVVACTLSWKYKKREREETLPNEQMFATDYYSRYTMENAVES